MLILVTNYGNHALLPSCMFTMLQQRQMGERSETGKKGIYYSSFRWGRDVGQERRGYTTVASDGGEMWGRREGDILQQLQMGREVRQERRGYRKASYIQIGREAQAGKKGI